MPQCRTPSFEGLNENWFIYLEDTRDHIDPWRIAPKAHSSSLSRNMPGRFEVAAPNPLRLVHQAASERSPSMQRGRTESNIRLSDHRNGSLEKSLSRMGSEKVVDGLDSSWKDAPQRFNAPSLSHFPCSMSGNLVPRILLNEATETIGSVGRGLRPGCVRSGRRLTERLGVFPNRYLAMRERNQETKHNRANHT